MDSGDVYEEFERKKYNNIIMDINAEKYKKLGKTLSDLLDPLGKDMNGLAKIMSDKLREEGKSEEEISKHMKGFRKAKKAFSGLENRSMSASKMFNMIEELKKDINGG